MLIETTAEVVIGEHVHRVEVIGEVEDESARILTVRGLPIGLEQADLHPSQEDALQEGLIDAAKRQRRLLHRLPSELRSMIGVLERAEKFRPMPGDPRDVADEKARAQKYAAERIRADLEKLLKEVA